MFVYGYIYTPGKGCLSRGETQQVSKVFLKSNQCGMIEMLVLSFCDLSCALVTNSRLVRMHRGGPSRRPGCFLPVAFLMFSLILSAPEAQFASGYN